MTILTSAFLALIMSQLPGASDSDHSWSPPLSGGITIERFFWLPHGEYQSGHRGIDVLAFSGQTVRSPGDALVTFAGVVVDRGVVTLQVDERTQVSFEPVNSVLDSGSGVAQGTELGTITGASHCGSNCLHIGVRVDGHYVNPLQYFNIGRPQLLPLKPRYHRD